jgi:hypothetical protein
MALCVMGVTALHSAGNLSNSASFESSGRLRISSGRNLFLLPAELPSIIEYDRQAPFS